MKKIHSLATCFFCLLIAVLVWSGYRAIRADRYYGLMERAEKSAVWRGVLHEGTRVLRFNPWRTKVHSYMGRAYIETGRHAEAIPHLEKVTRHYPYHMNALLNLGVAYAAEQRYKESLATYWKVVRIKPDYAKVHNNIANVFVAQQRYWEAADELKLATRYDPTGSAIPWLNLGMVSLRLFQLEEAREALTKALALDPNLKQAKEALKWLDQNRPPA